MKFSYLLLLSLFGFIHGCTPTVLAQSTTVSVTVVDQSSQVWKNGTVSYVFQPNPSFSGTYQWNGAALPKQYLTPQIVTLSSSGAGSWTIPTSTAITPAGSSWRYVVCPNASSACTVINIAATGSTQNISSQVTAVTPAISIQAGPMPLAYTDSEIMTTPNQGGIYFNVTSFLPKYFDGSAWQFYGSGGGGGVTFINGVSGSFTFTGSGVSCTGTTCTFSGGSSFPYPGAGIANSTGSAWGTSFTIGGAGETVPTETGTFVSGNIAIYTGTAGQIGNGIGITASDIGLLDATQTWTGTDNNFLHLTGATITDSTCVMHAGVLGSCITVSAVNLDIIGITGSTQCLQVNTSGTVSGTGSACGSGGGGGTVTSVGLSLPSFLTVTVSPITASGSLTATLTAQAANTVFGNFTSGSAAPTFSASPVFSAAGLINVPACATCIQGTTGTAYNGLLPVTQGGILTELASNFQITTGLTSSGYEEILTTNSNHIFTPDCLYVGNTGIDCGGIGSAYIFAYGNCGTCGAGMHVRDEFAETTFSISKNAVWVANNVAEEHSVFLGVVASTAPSGNGLTEPDTAYLATEFDNIKLHLTGLSVDIRGGNQTSTLSGLCVGCGGVNLVSFPTLTTTASSTVAFCPSGTGGTIGLCSIASGTGTVTSIATTGPIGGGTITTTGTITCTTCVTSAASLTLNQLMLGAGSQGISGNANLTWDATNGRLLIGAPTSTAAITLIAGTTAPFGINFGDTSSNLYRSAANTIKTDGSFNIGGSGSATNNFVVGALMQGRTIGTATNCASATSPAVCGSAAAGAFTIAAAATTITVNTSIVTANSEIVITPDASLSTRLSVTCNTSIATIIGPVVTSRIAGTSFTVSITGTLVTNPACYTYVIFN